MKICACRNCGNVVALDLVTGTPGKACPVCKAPLDEQAVAATSYASPEARQQALEDVAATQAEAAAMHEVTATVAPAAPVA